MLHIDRHHDSQLAAHLSSLDYDSYVSDTADEIIADSILDDIMHRIRREPAAGYPHAHMGRVRGSNTAITSNRDGIKPSVSSQQLEGYADTRRGVLPTTHRQAEGGNRPPVQRLVLCRFDLQPAAMAAALILEIQNDRT